MAVRRSLTQEQFELIEKDLLRALARDSEHQFAFDGKLKFFSRRYNCTMEAVDVHYDPAKNDIVLVGAFLSGTPQFDTSRGYSVIKPELELPFREVYADMKATEGYNEGYVISKTRKAVLDKCLAYPMGQLLANGAGRDGCISLDEFRDFERKPPVLPGRRDTPQAMPFPMEISVRDGQFTFRDRDGRELNLRGYNMTEIQAVGKSLLEVRQMFVDARKDYIAAKNGVVREHAQTSERDEREGEKAGLTAIYEHNYPVRICHMVARNLSASFPDAFDRSEREVRKGMNDRTLFVAARSRVPVRPKFG